MKQLVIISGKGGVGKTVIAAACASLAENAIIADCDVDAANLHLLLQPKIREKGVFKSGVTACIDPHKCKRCGLCQRICRFGAVGDDFSIDPVVCEGCSFCHFVCPQQAITMHENTTGTWLISKTRFGPLVHASLNVCAENSGKLVTLVRQKARALAEQQAGAWIIIDGAPGIGCPVIASITGTDCALVVIEPTLASIHDAKRVIDVARHFNVPVKALINKYDLNVDMTNTIRAYCTEQKIELVGTIPFSQEIVEAMVAGKTIPEYVHGPLYDKVEQLWDTIRTTLTSTP